MIYLLFVNDGVALDVGGRTDDFFCTLSQLVGEVLGGRHVSLLELVLLHAVADQEVVGDATLVELHIILEVLVLFLVKQVLLSALGNVVVQQGVALVELSLIFTNARAVLFL